MDKFTGSDFVMRVTRTSVLPSIYGPIRVERSVPGHRSITIKNALKARAVPVHFCVQIAIYDAVFVI